MTTEVKVIEYGPAPGATAVVRVQSVSQHVDLNAYPELLSAVSRGKPLMLSADQQCVLYTWAPTTAGMSVFEGATGSSQGSATQMGAMLFGRTAVPEIAPQGTVGLVVKAPSGPTPMRIWWGQ